MQVVLADGQIIDVNYQSYPDLYFALRGGGNNFGIVTRFDLTTHAQGPMWSGTLAYLDTNQAELISAFVNYGANAPSDPNAALIFNFAYAEGQFLAVTDIEYATPTVNPPIFDNFTAIPAISNNLAIRTLPEVTDLFQVDNPSGLRESYWTATFHLTEDMTTYVVNTFKEEVDQVANATGLLPAVVLQVITTDMMKQMQKNGGNALGLNSADGNLLLLNLSFMWADAADDEAILAALGAITSKSIAYAKQKQVYHPYLYMNYASQFQAVIPSYGAQNFQRLQQVARKYDPSQVFQRLQPGYFKLSPSAPDTEYP
jgi:FAD/FMN-containing dehydrogenase